MPISKNEYEAGATDSKLLDLLIKNPTLAYSSKELITQFDKNVTIELEFLLIKGIIKAKIIINPDSGERDVYFILAKKP